MRTLGGAAPAHWTLLFGVVALVSVWELRHVLLLVFASVLLAVLLRGVAAAAATATRLPVTAMLFCVSASTIALLASAFFWQGPRIAEEAGVLRSELPGAVASLRARIEEVRGVRRLSEKLPSSSEIVGDGDIVVERLTSVATSTVGLLAAGGLLPFLAFLLALSPRLYRDGLLRLLPDERRGRAREVLANVRDALWWWSLGRLISMSFVGITTGVGLVLLGIPLAFLLGLIAALLSFIPNLGPIVAAIPAILIALAHSPRAALWVIGLYVAVQAVQNLALDPVIDRRTVYLPPALTVVAQLVLGSIAGLLGVALAAPLTAAAMVIVSVLWVNGVLARAKHGTAESAV